MVGPKIKIKSESEPEPQNPSSRRFPVELSESKHS